MSTQAVVPDFIPADNGPDFIPDSSPIAAPPDSQPSALMRFLKAGGKQLYAGTAGAGPQQSGTITQDFSEQEAQARSGTLPSIWQTLKNSFSDVSPSNIDIGRTLSSFNPIDVQRFQSGDTAGGLGSSLANLLMLRQGLKTRSLPEGGRSNAYAEQVQPLAGYTKISPRPRLALPAAPIELGPSSITPQSQEGLLPAASQLYRDAQGNLQRQFLTRPLRPGESPPVNKDVNTQAQSAFIDAMQEIMNRQTETESPFQIADRRMAETAKTPFDRATPKRTATASGPVESPQFAYRTRDAGETGIMPNAKKTAQASVDPAKVQSYQEGRAAAQNHPQEMVRIDLSKLDPNEYEVQPNGYVNFKSAVPESFIEKMGSKAINDMQPRVPTSDADLQNLLMQSLQMVKARAGRK